MERELAAKLEQIQSSVPGRWGIVIRDVEAGDLYMHGEEERFYAASMIKLFVMSAVFRAQAQGLLRLSEPVVVTRDDLAAGSGILWHLEPGLQLTVLDLVRLMIILSDNSATNILIDRLGRDWIRQSMERDGCTDSTFFNKLNIVPDVLEGSNQVTARDVARWLGRLAEGKLVSLHASTQMMGILRHQFYRDKFAAKLPDVESQTVGAPPQWSFANKTGMVTGIEHDAGVLHASRRTFVLVGLWQGERTLAAKDAMAQMGRMVFDFACSEQKTP